MQIKEYLNEICEQIKYKPVRKEIAKEIEDHINDIKEDLKNNGEDEEKAEIKAISQMGNAKEIGKKLNKIHKPKLDWKLLIITLVLIFFGFIVSFIKTINNIFETNELNYMTRYILVTLFGTILGIVAYFGNYKKVQKYSYLLYIIASGIIIYTFLFGYLSYMKIGNRYISATTIAIPLYIISFVGFLMEKSTKNFLEIKILNKLIKVKDNLIKLLLLVMISIVLIGMLPSKASVIILTLNYLILLSAKMILTQKNNIKTVLKLWGIALILGISFVISILVFAPYQVERIDAIFNPEKYAQDEGWLALNRKMIINSAQAFGEAEDMGNANVLLDEGDNYALVSVLAHYGWVISSAMVIAIILFSCKLILDAVKIKDEYGKLLIIGISTMFILESILNILMNFNLGIEADFSIPFISYGEINMIVNLAILGFLLSIYKRKDIYMYECERENIAKISC